MPIRGFVGSSNTISNEHLKVEVHGHGSYEAKVNEETEFTIDASKASTYGAGMPIVRLTGVQADVEVRIQQMEPNVFLCSYIPTSPGKNKQLSIRLNCEVYFRCLSIECDMG
jgi:hypothetical protein